MLTQIWLGPKKSWYMRTTSAVLVVPPAGIDAATHGRSTPKGEQLVLPHAGTDGVVPFVQVWPCSVDLKTSAWRVEVPAMTLRLHRYTEFDWSVARQSSPLFRAAVVTGAQDLP